nr:upf0743 protein [Quercus suber]
MILGPQGHSTILEYETDMQQENCGDVLTKKKLDPHRNQCRGASFTCLDCMVHFLGTDYRSHTSCISEAQKYQGHLYRGDKENKKNNKRKSIDSTNYSQSQEMVPKRASVEDVPESQEDMYAVAVVDVPPRAPTPPQVNVFDYLVNEVTPGKTVVGPQESRMVANGDSQYSQRSDGDYRQNGYSYGNAPLPPSLEKYDSWQYTTDSQNSHALMPPPYTTPAPKHERKEKRGDGKSDKKRKRHHIEDLDLSSTKRPSSRDSMIVDWPSSTGHSRALHSGLTGGLSRLVTDPEFYEDRIEVGPTPISPIKRSKHDRELRDARRKSSYASRATSKSSTSKHSEDKQHHRKRLDSSSDDDRHRVSRKEYKVIEYPDRPSSVQPTASNQLVQHRDRAELFLSFVKGPDSERGCSINKALKRYHRERDVRGEEKEEDDKELWKSLRLRRNDRGEIVVFV